MPPTSPSERTLSAALVSRGDGDVPPPKTSRVAIADCCRRSREALCGPLRELGSTVTELDDRAGVRACLSNEELDIIVLELRLSDGPTSDLIPWIQGLARPPRIVIATQFGSVASAVRCTRLGVDAYLLKPIAVEGLLAALRGPEQTSFEVPEHPMRLDRALWEYIHRAVEAHGSIAQGAEALGLDRRSLRRMLAKYAPLLESN